MLKEKKGGVGGEGREAGEAYQTGFQITEVILFVIDSPIATYRISLGSSWENYKRDEVSKPERRKWEWSTREDEKE